MKQTGVLPFLFFTFLLGSMAILNLTSNPSKSSLEVSSFNEGLPQTLSENTNPKLKKRNSNTMGSGGSLSLSSVVDEEVDQEFSKMDPNLYERETILEAQIEY